VKCVPVVDRANIDATIEKLRADVHRRWEEHGELKAFLADHRAAEWSYVRQCRLRSYHTMQDASDSDRVKVWGHACNLLPWCLECVGRQHWRRMRDLQDKWMKCTPADQPPRFSHVVITAPVYDAAPSWGLAASKNPKLFMAIVWRALNRLLPGGGLGAHMSYQDFGERGLAARHPHIDLTLNGYRVLDGRVRKLEDDEVLPYVRVGSGGERYADAVRIVEEEAQAIHLGARATSIYVGEPLETFARYHKILGYQVREMIDLRKLHYDASQQLVGWESYKDDHLVTWMPVKEWLAAYTEYCWRLKLFEMAPCRSDGKRKTVRTLHRSFGHMADGEIGKTQRATGGQPEPHADGCPCKRCGEWRRVFLQAGDLEEWHALAGPYDG
jgi:hypothetical protein